MSLMRVVDPEELDGLTPNDPVAVRSRLDLRRVHRAMGTCTLLVRQLTIACSEMPKACQPLRVLEVGAGDGSLMLRVANALKPKWPAVELSLLDQVDLLDSSTVQRYQALGWNPSVLTMNVLDWAQSGRADTRSSSAKVPEWDLVVANLFLHHFSSEPLSALLAAIADRSRVFVACEPRRSRVALAASHCIGALGVNSVTRADAVTSVRAGFSGRELTALWPSGQGSWSLDERPAGLFSHCFSARRLSHGATANQ